MSKGAGYVLMEEILKQIKLNQSYEIIQDKDFLTLALAIMKLEQSFCTFIEEEKYIDTISPNAVMVITTEELSEKILKLNKGVCVCEIPRILFFQIHNYLEDEKSYIREKSITKIGENCKISTLSSIAQDNVVIGNNVVIEEFVVIRPNTVIGDNSIIRAGSIIGGEGFEFKREQETILGVRHLGGVNIGHHVEVQHNVCIDRAVYPWDNTEIGNYTKIDNLVYIAHGVKIQENVLIVAQSGIGGRTIIESGTWIGLGASVKNGNVIGEKARVNMGAVVTKPVEAKGSVTGNFAIDHERFIQNLKKTL